MLTLVYESFHGLAPSYINKLLTETNSSYNLCGKHSLSIPRVQSTKIIWFALLLLLYQQILEYAPRGT